MRLSHKNRVRHDRRVARAKELRETGFLLGLLGTKSVSVTNEEADNFFEELLSQRNPNFSVGETVKIINDNYGVRYENTKGVIESINHETGAVQVKSNRRKTPLTVRFDDISKAA